MMSSELDPGKYGFTLDEVKQYQEEYNSQFEYLRISLFDALIFLRAESKKRETTEMNEK